MNNEYLFNDDFLTQAKKKFDTLLIEHSFTKEHWSNFIWAVAHHTKKDQKLLIIVSTTPVEMLFPLIQYGTATTTLINPSCWIPGFANKWFWDKRDIAKARDFWLHVIEPLYQEQIPDFFDNEYSTYIRLNEHIAWKEQLPLINNQKGWFYHFQEQWYHGDMWTILCFWSTLVDSLYSAGFLQQEWITMDVFAHTDLFFTLQESFKESIQRTEKLYIILDQHLGSLYEIWLLWTLCEAWLTTPTLTFITPYYQHISSLSLEYMYEQAKVDSTTLSQRIQGK